MRGAHLRARWRVGVVLRACQWIISAFRVRHSLVKRLWRPDFFVPLQSHFQMRDMHDDQPLARPIDSEPRCRAEAPRFGSATRVDDKS